MRKMKIRIMIIQKEKVPKSKEIKGKAKRMIWKRRQRFIKTKRNKRKRKSR